MKVAAWLVIALTLAITGSAGAAQAGRLRPFTVADDITLWHFNYWGSLAPPVIVSPNRRFVAIRAERGLLGKDKVEDELRVYDMAQLSGFVLGDKQSRAPMPKVEVRESSYKEGPIIKSVCWLPNSTGLTFLLRTGQGNFQLVVLSLNQRRPKALSLVGQNVTEFVVRDARHYAYTVDSPAKVLKSSWTNGRVTWDVTGYPISTILSWRRWRATERDREVSGDVGRSVLWAAIGPEPHIVLNRHHAPIVLYPGVNAPPVLSPDGHTLALAVPVQRVPKNWLHEFRPPYVSDPYNRLRFAGPQDLDSDSGFRIVTKYAIIDLSSGDVRAVNDAPTGGATAWVWTGALEGKLAWSYDGDALLLPDAYLQPHQPEGMIERPCVAVFYLMTRRIQCLEPLRSLDTRPGGPEHGGPEAGAFVISALGFANHRSDKVIMRYIRYPSYVTGTKVFKRTSHGTWEVMRDEAGRQCCNKSLDVYIKQGINEPPVLMAVDRRTTIARVIWDPNPQLHYIALGKVSVYRWRDASGRTWNGGLYVPRNYVAGRRYPLVIQTHGFAEGRFQPSGLYPTAFAAQALASHGIIVLQVPNCPVTQKPESGPCEVDAYDSAVEELAHQGLVDPSRVGIIGFSYTVYTVLHALTTGSVHFAAASVTDGWNYGYWEYLTNVDSEQDMYSRIADETVGGKPFGAGLLLWLRRAPDFNMEKVHTPLLAVSLGGEEGGERLFEMWEPYAALRYLERPVDLLWLKDVPYEHVLTNPALRMASQGGSVDWFRFWLDGYEASDRSKAAQYRLWERLCDMQAKENPGVPAFCVPSRLHGTQHQRMEEAAEGLTHIR